MGIGMSGGSVSDLRRLAPSRVCLIKPSALGDIVHALPVLSALRDRWPRAHIAWVVHSGLRGLVDGHPRLDQTIVFDRRAMAPDRAGLAALTRFARTLRQEHFDLAIDLQGLFRSGLMALATGAPVRVGLGRSREGSRFFYTHRVPEPVERPHAVDRLLAVASAFGADIARPRFETVITADDRAWAERAVGHLPRPRLMLNPGARWVTKRWPPERFAAVARRMAVERGASIVLVGGPDDLGLVEDLKDHLGDHLARAAIDLVGRTTLPQLAAVSASCDVVLSNDTGPLHLAAAAGARVVGVYTCTRPAWTGPYGDRATSVRSLVSCAGSCIKTCPRMDCMVELGADRVARAVATALDAAAADRSSSAA
jgi:lipopolysaccharide heptosyltransferase I